MAHNSPATLADIPAPAGALTVGPWHCVDDADSGRLFTVAESGPVRAFGLQTADGAIEDPVEITIADEDGGAFVGDIAAAKELHRHLTNVLNAVSDFDAAFNKRTA